MLNEYYDASHAVDDHNNRRQGKLGLAKAWRTQDAWFRVKTKLMAIVAVDAVLAYMHFGPDAQPRAGRKSAKPTPQHKYLNELCMQLLTYHSANGSARAIPRTPLQTMSSVNVPGEQRHTLGRLGERTSASGRKYQTRQKCIVCVRVHQKRTLTMYK